MVNTAYMITRQPKVVVNPDPDPDPDCRFCKGTGMVTLATTSKPCLECLAPWEGWNWPNMNGHSTVFYTDMSGHEIEVTSVGRPGEVPDDAVSVGRLCRFSRAGKTTGDELIEGERIRKKFREKA